MYLCSQIYKYRYGTTEKYPSFGLSGGLFDW